MSRGDEASGSMVLFMFQVQKRKPFLKIENSQSLLMKTKQGAGPGLYQGRYISSAQKFC